jgi:hypothetical protein
LSRKLNQHFVPQFHLRLFSGDRSFIHLASRNGSRLIRFASIKGQCARHKFYGSTGIEDWLGSLETRHSMAYRDVVRRAWTNQALQLSPEEAHTLREAVLLQRCRTPRAARINAGALDKMMLSTYREHLLTLPQTAQTKITIDAIERGKATLNNTEHESLMNSIMTAFQCVDAISDLSLLILKNHTAFPFLMGDAPCTFSNHYLRMIKDKGVLGFFSKGLMITLPLNNQTQLLLYDPRVYNATYGSDCCLDVINKADVSQLNALQLHSAEQNLYYHDVSSETYIRELLELHRTLLQHHESQYCLHGIGTMWIDGELNTRDLVQVFEPQLPITPDLSFFRMEPLPRNLNPLEPRRTDVSREVTNRITQPGHNAPFLIAAMARWIEANIRIERT